MSLVCDGCGVYLPMGSCECAENYKSAGDAKQNQESALDRQEGGDHYRKMPIQPFEYSMANGLDPMQHTAIKYISRFRDKNGVEDLKKAIHTIELLIEWEQRSA